MGARVQVGDLTEVEQRVWDGFSRGLTIDLGGGDPTADAAAAEDWGPSRCVRAAVLTQLLLGASRAEPGYAAKLALVGARVTGQLDLAGATVEYGLDLRRCWLDETIDVSDAKLRTLSLISCRIPRFDGWGMEVDGPVALTGARLGQVGLGGARIAGRFHLTGATLHHPDDYALVGTRLIVAQTVLAREITAVGEVRLLDAEIGGALIFSRATLNSPGRTALNLRGIHLTQNLDCDDGFTAVGQVRLQGAQIGGAVNLQGARLSNPGGRALGAADMTVRQGVLCVGGFTATGGIRLARARVGGQLVLDADVIDGAIDLDEANIQTLVLPSTGIAAASLDGLSYADLKPNEPAAARVGWIRRDPGGYRAQPYEQLASHYRRLGHDEQARRVLLAKRRAYRATLPPWRRLSGGLMDMLAGYGYAPGRAVAWLVAAWLAGWWYFAVHRPIPIAPATPSANPALYALDLVIPTSPLSLQEQYAAPGAGLWMAIGLQALGWGLSLAVLPALTRALGRN